MTVKDDPATERVQISIAGCTSIARVSTDVLLPIAERLQAASAILCRFAVGEPNGPMVEEVIPYGSHIEATRAYAEYAYRYDPFLDIPDFGPVIYSGFKANAFAQPERARAIREFQAHFVARYPFADIMRMQFSVDLLSVRKLVTFGFRRALGQPGFKLDDQAVLESLWPSVRGVLTTILLREELRLADNVIGSLASVIGADVCVQDEGGRIRYRKARSPTSSPQDPRTWDEPRGPPIRGYGADMRLMLENIDPGAALGDRSGKLNQGDAKRAPCISTFKRGRMARQGVRRARDYIHGHLGADLRLADIAGVAGISPYHFSRAFKNSTGLSPHQYVLRARVEAARELLITGELSLSEIALRVGFYDQSHLARHFKGRYGVPPSALAVQAE